MKLLPGRVRSLTQALRRGSIDELESPPHPQDVDVQALVREYRLLGKVLLDFAEEQGTEISMADMRVFTDFLASLVAEGVAMHAKRLEQETAAARRNEERLRRVLEATVAGTWELDVPGQTVFADSLVRALHGLPLEGPIPLAAALASVHPEDLPPLQRAIEAAIDPKGSRRYLMEYRVRDSEDQERWLEARGETLFDERGAALQILGTAMDIHSRKQAEHARAEFERQLIGIVSHDLGNPLAVTKMGIDLLLRQEALPPRSAAVVQRMKNSLEGMGHLVNDLLDFTQARLGTGLSIIRSPTDLHAVIRRVTEDLRMVFPARQLELQQEGDGEGSFDPDRLAQVAVNLIRNALKYGPAHSPIRVSTRGEGDRIELQVTNFGPPIDAEVLPRLFEPMQGGAPTPVLGRSVGLGLYIVKHIVDGLGGAIHVSSSAETGTTFRVIFPRSFLPLPLRGEG